MKLPNRYYIIAVTFMWLFTIPVTLPIIRDSMFTWTAIALEKHIYIILTLSILKSASVLSAYILSRKFDELSSKRTNAKAFLILDVIFYILLLLDFEFLSGTGFG